MSRRPKHLTPAEKKADRHVADRFRARRIELRLTQNEIAAKLGVSFQQVQKMENGADRIPSGRLYLLSEMLGVPLSYFFEGLE